MPIKKNPPSDLEAHLGFWLRYVSNHVSDRFRKLLEVQGTSVTEWVALRTLFKQTHTNHAELISSLGMTKGAASKVISRLEAKGWAQRSFAEGRAREQVLALTAKGRALVPKLAAQADENEAYFFGHLPPTEYDELVSALQGLVKHHQLKEIPIA